MSQTDLIIHDEKDNVAVVVIDKTSKNQECMGWIMENDKTVKIKSIKEIRVSQNYTQEIIDSLNRKEKFSIDNRMLTPTLKLKRYKIIQKYKNEFQKLY